MCRQSYAPMGVSRTWQTGGHGRLTTDVAVVEGSRLRSFVHRSLWPVVELWDLPFWEGAGIELEGGLPALSVGLGV